MNIKRSIATIMLLTIITHHAVLGQGEESLTTIIVVRHAEKINEYGNNDPGLSEEGLKRADRLSKLFAEENIAAIYSTPFNRTMQTVTPLAEQNNITITSYSPVDEAAFQKMVTDHAGEKIIVCAHSNTIPILLNYFTQSKDFLALREDEYDKVYIVTISSTGINSVVKLVAQ